jgi:hypothetical protein
VATPALSLVSAASSYVSEAAAAASISPNEPESTQNEARDVSASELPQPGSSPVNVLTTSRYCDTSRRRVSPREIGKGGEQPPVTHFASR